MKKLLMVIWISHFGWIFHWVLPIYHSKVSNKKSVKLTNFAYLKIATFCFYVWSNFASYKMVQGYFIYRALFGAEDQTQGFAQALENVLLLNWCPAQSFSLWNWCFGFFFFNVIFTWMCVGIKYPWSWTYRQLWAT